MKGEREEMEMGVSEGNGKGGVIAWGRGRGLFYYSTFLIMVHVDIVGVAKRQRQQTSVGTFDGVISAVLQGADRQERRQRRV
eukprot:scaffold228967_cov27-Tisochrysis_lutea.AAC.3